MKRILFITLTMLSIFTFAQDTEVVEASFTDLILGEGVSMTMFVVFTIFGLVGLLTSVAFDIYSSGAKSKELSLKVFWKDNKWILLLSLLVIVIAILFSEQLMSIAMSNWAAFLAGFTADKLIENLMQRRRRQKTEQNETKPEGSN